jgi:hypothetical protein
MSPPTLRPCLSATVAGVPLADCFAHHRPSTLLSSSVIVYSFPPLLAVDLDLASALGDRHALELLDELERVDQPGRSVTSTPSPSSSSSLTSTGSPLTEVAPRRTSPSRFPSAQRLVRLPWETSVEVVVGVRKARPDGRAGTAVPSRSAAAVAPMGLRRRARRWATRRTCSPARRCRAAAAAATPRSR